MDTNPINIFEKLKYNKNEEVKMIALSKIKCDPSQPRKTIDEEKLKELALDLECNGLLQPILLRQDGINFLIITGERRFRAFKLLGKETIPAIIRKDYSPESISYLQMSENLKRDDLKFYEIAEFIATRIEYGEAKGDIAKKLGFSAQRISDYLSFIHAPEWLKDLKGKFKSPQLFSKFAKEASMHDSLLKDYLSSLDDEYFSNATINSFKARLVKASGAESTSDVTSSSTLNSQDDHDLETGVMASGAESTSDVTSSSTLSSQDDHDLETGVKASGAESTSDVTNSSTLNSQDDHDLETGVMASGAESTSDVTSSSTLSSQDDHDLETGVMASGAESTSDVTNSSTLNSQDDHDLETGVKASGAESTSDVTSSSTLSSQDDHDLETLVRASGAESTSDVTNSSTLNSQDDHDLETLVKASGAESQSDVTSSSTLSSQDDHDLETLVKASGTESQLDDNSTHPHLLKKPLILGFVNSREAELLYKQKAKTAGFVVVKFENGDKSEILAESFQINRIIEG